MNRDEIEQELLRLWNIWSDFGGWDEDDFPRFINEYKLNVIKQTLDYLDSIGYDNSRAYINESEAFERKRRQEDSEGVIHSGIEMRDDYE